MDKLLKEAASSGYE